MIKKVNNLKKKIRCYLTKNAFQTKILGKTLAEHLLKSGLKQKTAIVLALEGDLGSGKTTFLQGFAKGLGVKEKILSPTFILIKRFRIKDYRFKNFYHIDCYRIQAPKEIITLGFKEIIASPQNIIAVEWADRIRKISPPNTIILKFKFINKKKRKIMLKLKNDWRKKTANCY